MAGGAVRNETSMKSVIIVAAHKPYRMPEDTLYLPVHVGRAGKADIGYTGDHTGQNISGKNPNFCELTGLYWAWKNLEYDALGLAHYRRHFAVRRVFSAKWDNVLDSRTLGSLLEKADAIVPVPRNYWIETNYQQYVHAHHAADLDVTRRILAERYPEYLEKYDEVMKRTWGRRFNMFVMKRETADAYCTWLFDVLFELEKRLDISGYSANDSRVFGFVAERLLDVWLETNRIRFVEQPVMFMEKQNWIRKGAAFLKRKAVGTLRSGK